MKFPFLVLTYGEFSKSKKLFIYEKYGEQILPIFSDIGKASAFAVHMEKVLVSNNDNRELVPHVCVSRSMTVDMLKVVSAFYGVNTIIADPGDDQVYDTNYRYATCEYTFEQLIDQLSEESPEESLEASE
jgi:hypothetical protein